jgi:hypothetical protein
MRSIPSRLSVFLILLLSGVLSVQAQGEARATRWFEAGGQTHTVVYSMAQARRIDLIVNTAISSVDTFVGLFRITSPMMRIEVIAQSPAGTLRLADASQVTAADGSIICRVRIYANRFERADAANQFTLAHEIGHCFQYAVRGTISDFAVEENGWWIEGNAEWLASQVYAPAGDRMRSTLADLYSTVATTPYGMDYDNFWFWEFITHRAGSGVVAEMLRDLPNSNTAQTAYLARRFGNLRDLFAGYGTALLGTQLRFQPALSNAQTIEVRSFPGVIPLITERLSVRVSNVTLPAVSAPNKGIRLRGNGLAALDMKVVFADGTSITGDGVIELCTAPRSLQLAIGRGDNTSETLAEIAVEEYDCTPPPAVIGGGGEIIIPEEVTGVDCPYGVWSLVSVPGGNTASDMQMDFTGSTLTIDGAGNMRFVYAATGTTVGEGLTGGSTAVTMDAFMAFSASGVGITGGPSEFTATGGTGSFEPGFYFNVTVNGVTQDMTSIISDFLRTGIGAPGSTLILRCLADGSGMEYVVRTGGADYVYLFSR